MFQKPNRTDRKKKERQSKAALKQAEARAKAWVRRRDRVCRFPLCRCREIGLTLEVSHHLHKGMGGNPEGDRNTPENMVLLCTHRHRDGRISRHHGTLRVRFLTRHGFEGPVAWMVDWGTTGTRWVEVARESAPGVWEPLTAHQADILSDLAMMER